MQYILSEEEYSILLHKVNSLRKFPDVKKLQEICTKAANEWPSFKGWDGKSEPQPWGCIITTEDHDEWYCDKCPVRDICPYEHKHWSK